MGKKRVIEKTEEEVIKEDQVVVKSTAKVAAKAPSKRKIEVGKIFIYSSYNNTMMSLTDMEGNLVFQTSAGALGFKGTKKSTPFAASKVVDALVHTALSRGLKKAEIYIKGVGSGRESALRSLGTKGIDIISIKDITPVAFNGPRPKKVRRL